ncbi:MAG: 1,2-phenylacetyl-CoA epoxidase subunit PaaC [Burkholderiaceae bacterium]|jgi:ring-1,2-phenylacetyl-CoA epoxidase subunit PaaC
MQPDEARFAFLLRQGDTTLILAQRLLEWCGHGPALEEDMAISNVALDLLGQTRLWYAYAVEVEGNRRSEDELAFLRDAPQYRNLLITELPNGNYADTMVRQLLFDAWHGLFLEGLRESTNERIAEIAQKAHKEVSYHLRRSSDLVVRLGDGTPESHQKCQAALDRLWPYTGEFFEMDALDERAQELGVGLDRAGLQAPWRAYLSQVLGEATLEMPPDGWMQTGGRTGRHTEHLGYILAEMQFLQRAYPGVQW